MTGSIIEEDRLFKMCIYIYIYIYNIYICIYNIYILPETLVILEMELDIIDSREILVFYLRTRIRF